MRPSEPWIKVRQHLDRTAPPLSQRDVIAGDRRSALRRPVRLGWGAAAVVAAITMTVVIVSLQRETTPTRVETGGSLSTSAPVSKPIDAAAPAVHLPEGTQISSVQLVGGRVWLAVASDGEGALVALDEASGEQLQRIPLPGEVPVGGLQLIGGQLVFPVIDELGTTGTGVYALQLATVQTSPSRVAPLDRAVNAGTDGTSLWLRGQDFAARLADIGTGAVQELPMSGFGWIDGDGISTWVTDRDAHRVVRFEGSNLVAQVEVEGTLGALLVTAVDVQVATGSSVVRLDRESLQPRSSVPVAEPVRALVPLGDEVLALGDRAVTRIDPKGAAQRVPVALDTPATAMAVNDSENSALVCAAESDCLWIDLH